MWAVYLMAERCTSTDNHVALSTPQKERMSTTFKPEKMNFTEGEVAQHLGISVERLHHLLDLNVFNDGGEKPDRITFRPQDLVMLGIWEKITPQNLVPIRRRG
jgi:hypothetical protein